MKATSSQQDHRSDITDVIPFLPMQHKTGNILNMNRATTLYRKRQSIRHEPKKKESA